ncbi:MAG: dienelactone hydrolase family protein [bacterium]|nr:dienelactone hydrolase family protein [bacterium]
MRLLPIVIFVMTMMTTMSAQTHSCCTAPNTFASLASNDAFVAAHVEPLHMQYPTDGELQSIEVSGGSPAVFYAVEPKAPTSNVLLVFPEWWGLNEHIKREADALFTALDGKVRVIAVDLYDGVVAYTRDEAAQAMKNLNNDRAEAIINAIIVKQQANARIATIGWCMGGGFALQAGIMAGQNAAAVVMYYGMPEKNVERLKTLRAPVLAIFASKDDWITPSVAKQFEKDMESADKKLTVKSYAAPHAFANPSNSEHDPVATADAMSLAVAFLREHLKL